MNRTASSTLMTEGSIWKKIVTFAFPLFLGNLFQQPHNLLLSITIFIRKETGQTTFTVHFDLGR